MITLRLDTEHSDLEQLKRLYIHLVQFLSSLYPHLINLLGQEWPRLALQPSRAWLAAFLGPAHRFLACPLSDRQWLAGVQQASIHQMICLIGQPANSGPQIQVGQSVGLLLVNLLAGH